MAAGSKIEWTDHTFNPWWGCVKVNSTCKHCYAESTDARWAGKGNGHWGPRSPRRMILGEWSKPLKWNADAEKNGVVARVFCMSMGDLFERFDGPVVNQQGQRLYVQGRSGKVGTDSGDGILPEVTLDWLRARVWEIIEGTPWLEWQLLTKRPANVLSMVPARWLEPGQWPENIITGYSAGNQDDLEGQHKNAEGGIADLLRVPGRRFLSLEPLTGPVDLRGVLTRPQWGKPNDRGLMPYEVVGRNDLIHWTIVGGESGPGARPMHPQWARDIRDQCVAAGVPFFFKQWGSHAPTVSAQCMAQYVLDEATVDEIRDSSRRELVMHKDGRIERPEANCAWWGCASDRWDSEYGHCVGDDDGPWLMRRFGKKAAGRLLDGREWNEMPGVIQRTDQCQQQQ